ncbi:formyl transferase [Ahrensia sp. R2A130]|uniref:formyl transferase n=1 Tax=Ahrensia sp. R2A130 TaxID=744979 RepID=UPI0001E0F098|nr:formyl transferase [Ahrensia sp. R2A130]EFL89895.1 putative formyl transferase [Ahrensia sp. R2A130]
MTMRIGILAEKDCLVFPWTNAHAVLTEANCKMVWFREIPTNRPRRGRKAIANRVCFRLVCMVEACGQPSPYQRYDSPEAVDLTCRFSGHFKDFDEDSLQLLGDQELDVIVRLGGRGIYRGRVLDVARLGIISVHHGDDRAYRGGPPGFWEVVNRERECGYVVQQLGLVLDHGDILARGAVPTKGTMTANQTALFDAADRELASVIEYIIATGNLPPAEGKTSSFGPIYTIPTASDLVRYLKCRQT